MPHFCSNSKVLSWNVCQAAFVKWGELRCWVDTLTRFREICLNSYSLQKSCCGWCCICYSISDNNCIFEYWVLRVYHLKAPKQHVFFFFSELVLPIPVLSKALSEMNCTWDVGVCALSCCLYSSIKHHESAHFSSNPWVHISRSTAVPNGCRAFHYPSRWCSQNMCVAYSKLQIQALGLLENQQFNFI